jgi:hypothetical protein
MRRAALEALTKRAVKNYNHIQTKEATILVSSLLLPSSDLKQDKHFKRMAASTIMSIVYDYPTIMSEHDHAVEKIERYNDRTSHAAGMGSYFVDIFPWMKHIPERFLLPSSRCLVVNTYGPTTPDSRNGSGKAYGHLQSTLRCTLAFSIVSKLTLYVPVLAVVSGTQLMDSKKGQWGEPAKFLRFFDTKSRSKFSKRDRNGVSCWTFVVSVYIISLIGHVMIQHIAVPQVPRRPLPPFRGGCLP